jgi:class 3 adenylate cyclase
MVEARVERRLAAILAADVAGYSRLMAVDEEGTLAALKAHRSELIDPKVAENRGRIVKTTGDGALVEFASAVDAVRCAVNIQRAMIERNTNILEERRLKFRMGINVGDVIINEGDIYGDGVNIAARPEGIAEAGGICISDNVYRQIEGKLQYVFREMGVQNLKNIAKPIEAFAVEVDEPGGRSPSQSKPTQEIKYCRTPDGVRLAYAISGSGPPLVKSANWLNHLEYDWESPVWRHVFREISRDHTLIRYDARGNGMSDWDVDELSLDVWINDLENGGRCRSGRAFSAARNFARLCRCRRLCCSSPGTGIAPFALWRLCAWWKKALAARKRKAQCHDDIDAPRLGHRRSVISTNVHGAVPPKRDARTGGFFQRTATSDDIARMCRSLLRCRGGYRHHRSTRKGHRENTRDARARRPCLSH